MPEVFKSLLASRKFVVALLAVVCATVLVAIGKLDTASAIKFAGGLVAMVIGSTALEDAAEKFSIPVTTTSNDVPASAPTQNVVVQTSQKTEEPHS